MEAIILAGGVGKRMRPLTDSMPKPMLKIQGKPLLEWSLLSLRPTIDRALIVVSYLKEQIEAFMHSQTIFADFQIVEQFPKPLGTGHALGCCKPHLRGDDFIVVNGDDLYSSQTLHELAKTPLGLIAVERDDQARWGVIICDELGRVIRLHEKPPDGLYPIPVLANTGAYKLNADIFEYDLPLSQRGEYEITDGVTYLAQNYTVLPVRTDFWVTIGTPDDYAAAQQLDFSRVISTLS